MSEVIIRVALINKETTIDYAYRFHFKIGLRFPGYEWEIVGNLKHQIRSLI